MLNDKSYQAASILMIQDPWWGRIGYDKSIDPKSINIYGTTSSPFWMCFSPPGISGPKGPGVSIYVRRDIPDLHARYSDTLPPHPDVLAIDVIYKGSRTTLVNAYLHGDSERYDESLNHLICHPYPTSHPIIIAGDFNAHHPNWALEGSKWVNNLPNPSARLLDNWASENDFHVLNDLTVPTRNGKKGQADSIIDLTLLNSIAVDAFVDFDWTCEAEGAMGSDHNIISWAIGAHDQTDAATHPKPPPTFTIDPELEEEWTNAFVAHLSNENLPSQPKTPSELDSMAVGILQAMANATEDSMPKKKQGAKSRRSPWWNSECSKALRDLKHPPTTALATPAVHACGALSDALGKRRAPLPPIRFGGGLVTVPQQKAIALTDKFFPKATSSRVSLEPLGIPQAPERPWHNITKEEIETALASSSNTSSPGAFGTNYRLLKWAFSVRPNPILNLYNGCLTLGYHPSCLRNAVIAVIPKPNRSNMSDPKSYRPISLLETLSKCLEKVVTRRLIFEAGKFDLIPHSQFGGRDMTSCADAGLCLTHDTRTQWALGNHVNFHFEKTGIRARNLPVDPILPTRENRATENRRNSVRPNQLARGRYPPGIPLSPILSSIYSIPLLRAIQDPQALTYAYVDDFSILAFSDSHASNTTILQNIANTANNTLRALGLEFELPKSDLIHFTSRKQQPSNAQITLTHDLGTSVITPKVVVRWLGFYLDQKLNFKEHVRYMANKANAILAGLRMLADTVKGMSMRHARILFIACVRPILTYGSLIWFHGNNQKTMIDPIQKAQNMGIRWLTGAFKTSPTDALHHLASIPPIHIYLQRLNTNAATKLRALPRHAEISRRLPKAWDSHDPTLPHPPEPKRRQTAVPSPIVRLAALSHPESEFQTPYLNPPWVPENPFPGRLQFAFPPAGSPKDRRAKIAENANRLIDALAHEGTLIGFSDGSKEVRSGVRKVGVGYSIVWKKEEVAKFSGGIGPRADIFDAEMLALALIVRRCTRFAKSHNILRIHIFSDNLAAVRIINKCSPHAAQYASILFRKEAHTFLQGNARRSIVVQWIPGHSKIEGNERADKLANAGLDSRPTPFFNRTATWAKCRATQRAAKSWGRLWAEHPHSKTVQKHIPRPPALKLHPIFQNPSIPRSVSSRLIHVMTGHGCFGEYKARMPFINGSAKCQCGDPNQTIPHLLFHCPLAEDSRKLLSKRHQTSPRNPLRDPQGIGSGRQIHLPFRNWPI
ncbi:Reverse transcriptase (RNA-dependent DNA polymerase) [Rhizoctonia solani]|uniref:Reverse transcriptase (RNA-dependent DNA polymerase) n=1 Tax=Rhizoctonia solani TaxID=456999 RepID=A0A8H7I4H7_9AGAM|nr:Reverse transcriptase (RNA-dependent DNA polymerase) [Rhizoctonia solani]